MTPGDAPLRAALAWARRERARFVDALAALVRVPSVSAEPRHAADVRRCARLLAARLDALGAGVRLVEGDRHPAVVGAWRDAGPRAPTVLVYAHYDVQPAGPPGAWRVPPFAGAVRDGALYGRGASDDKGPLVAHLAAIESWRRGAGALPVNVVCLLDGEEEIGSPTLQRMLRAPGAVGRVDVAVVSDTRMLDRGHPTIVHALRGALTLEVELRTAPADLHAGAFGGAVLGAADALARVLASLHDATGRVAVPGFHDRVRPLSRAERVRLARAGPDDAALLADARIELGHGEPGYSARERTTIRPSLVVTGCADGAGGAGGPAVVPAAARARLDVRLVPDQEPPEIARLVAAHIARVAPAPARTTVRVLRAARPVVVSPREPVVRAAARALGRAFGAAPAVVRSGGTIPVVSALAAAGVPVALSGFALPGDGMHAPNEHLDLDVFDRAVAACVHLHAALAAEHRRARPLVRRPPMAPARSAR